MCTSMTSTDLTSEHIADRRASLVLGQGTFIRVLESGIIDGEKYKKDAISSEEVRKMCRPRGDSISWVDLEGWTTFI